MKTLNFIEFQHWLEQLNEGSTTAFDDFAVVDKSGAPIAVVIMPSEDIVLDSMIASWVEDN